MSVGAPLRVQSHSPRSLGCSLAVHAGVILALSLHLVHAPHVAPTKLPGTHMGTALLTYYSPGSAVAHQGGEVPRPLRTSKALTAPAPVVTHATPKPLPSVTAAQGTGSSVQSGFGEGDLRIALPSFHPPPAPSLATLPPGAAGDVVLDAVIDEKGRISKLTVLHSLGTTIDQSVIATVEHWTFTPATLDGKPVPSGQELHFHYQRGESAA